MNEVQESQVNLLLCDKSPAVIDWADVDKDICDDPSSVFFDFHKPVQNLQHKSSFLPFVDDLFDHRIELGNVEENKKCQLFSQVVLPFFQVKNKRFNKSSKFFFQRLARSEVN